MSEDGFSDPYDEPSMDLIIETLTGTSFEMRVYPTDTVLDIKNKIHRVEGIPIYHQNLLFQMKELQDYVRLCDAGIVSGSVLKLVLSMRGGPISTRRLSTCDHHIIWKDLKELIEHSRDDTDKSGSKVSVLVLKEGEVLSLIRVIENEDGTYSPYADKAISPPFRNKEKDDLQQTFFKKISEDMEMATKMHLLKSKMKRLRQQRHAKPAEQGDGAKSRGATSKIRTNDGGGGGDFIELDLPSANYKFEKSRIQCLEEIKMFESKISVQENITEQPENGEIALKEKHRTRVRVASDKAKKMELNCDAKPYFCKNLHIFEPDHKKEQTDEEKIINNSILSPLYNRYSTENNLRHRRTSQYDNKLKFDDTKLSDPLTILEDTKQDATEVPCSETLSLSARNRVHLTRLVLQDTERGKTSPDSIELEENSPEMWEIQPDTIKSSGAYKVGLLKRRTSVDHNYDPDFGLESSTNNLNLDREEFNQNGEYEVFGRNFYHVPQFVSAPSAIPPQYAPKDERICDLYLGSPVSDTKIRRSPLYGRRSKNNTNIDYNIYAEEASRSLENLGRSFDEKKLQNSSSAQFYPKLNMKSETNFSELASNIERLQNDYSELDYEDFDVNYGDDVFGYYNTSCTSELDKILNCNHPRYKEGAWNDVERLKSDDAHLANEIKRLSFDIKIDDEKRGKVQIETTKLEDLPAVVSKKRMRCGQCNKRLNITNIYNCRCGRIFCSQHRYSESHDCKYDYKSEGRKLLEQQNPLVTATKLTKF